MDKQVETNNAEMQAEANLDSKGEPHAEPQESNITEEGQMPGDDSESVPDWLEEAPSEAELTGEASEEPGMKDPDPSRPSGEEETKAGDESGEDDTDEDKPAEGEKPKDGEEKSEGEDEDDQPAEGDEKTVPLKALQAEREKRKAEREQRLEVQAKLKDAEEKLARRQTSKPATDTRKDVKQVEVPEELKPQVNDFQKRYPQYAGMATEDSTDGQELRARLEDYGPEIAADYARGANLERQIDADRKSTSFTETNEYLNTCRQGLNDLFGDEGAAGESAQAAVKFAGERGLSSDTIWNLTNPATILVNPETGEQTILGHKAVEVAGFLKDTFDSSSPVDVEAIKAELEPAIRAEVTKELMDKFKGGGGSQFRSLGDAPGASDQPAPGSGHTLTEAELANLSDTERAKYLGG